MEIISIKKLFIRVIFYNTVVFLWVLYFLYCSNVFYLLPGYNLGLHYSWLQFIYLIPVISICSIFIPYKIENITDLIFLASILIYWFPLLYLLSDRLILFSIFAINLLFTIVIWNILKKRTKIRTFPKKIIITPQFKLIILVALLFYVLIFFVSFGFKTNLEYTSSLYEIRDEYKMASYGHFEGLLMMLSEYLLIPFILFFSFNTKGLTKLIMFFVIFLISSQLFLFTALKSAILLPIFLILLYLIFDKRNEIIKYKNFLLIVIILLVFAIFLLKPEMLSFIINHLLRRAVLSPPVNAYYHIDYFTDNYGLISNGIGKPLGELVSPVYYKVNGNATTGLVADTLGRGGIILFILFPIFYSSILLIIRYVSSFYPLKYQVILFGNYMYILLNASIFTTLWSYGLIGMIIISFMLSHKISITARKDIKSEYI